MAHDGDSVHQHPRSGEVHGTIRAALAEIEAAYGCRVGFCVEGLEGPLVGTRFCTGGDEALPSASLIKVLVLTELLRRVDSGSVSLADKLPVADEDVAEDSGMVERERLPAELGVGRLAEGMICVSDNAATNLLISLLGEDRINALAHSLGLRRTVLRRRMMDFEARARGEENVTSASDMVALLAAIWRGTFLSPGSRAFALDLLARQRLTSKVPFSLPAGSRFLHKTGELDGVENDAGLVLVPGRTFALAVLVEGDVELATDPVASAVSAVCKSFSTSR